MDFHRAASGTRRKNAQARSRAAQPRQAAEHPRGGGREMVSISRVEGRSDGRRRAHARRRHQLRGTRARAAAAHPAARSRTPTCDGRWRCRRTPPRARREVARRSPPPHTPVSVSSRVDMRIKIRTGQALTTEVHGVKTHEFEIVNQRAHTHTTNEHRASVQHGPWSQGSQR